jgi:hypothetical protein
MRVELSGEGLESCGGESVGANVPADVSERMKIGGNSGYSLKSLGSENFVG